MTSNSPTTNGPLLLRSITALHAERVLRIKARTPKRSLKVIWADVLGEANLIVAHSPDRWTMTAQARALAERAYISLCDEVLQNLPRTQTQRNADQYLWAQHRAGVEIEFKAGSIGDNDTMTDCAEALENVHNAG